MEKILLYYKYVTLEDPVSIANWQRSLGEQFGLMGRVLIAPEGINGTVSGPNAAIESYQQETTDHPLFADLIFKKESCPPHCFPRLQVTVKKNIVQFGTSISPNHAGIHISPAQAHLLMQEQPDDLLIFDARNAFESRIGAFEHAVKPPIEFFRDLPTYIDTHEEIFKNKRVLMYCTGGIRCELASAYLAQKNIAKEVMQLEDGIIAYAHQFPDGGFFHGKNYVFDARVAVPITDEILTTCDICTTQACDEYTHCLNASCNKQFICCITCKHMLENMCSTTCQTAVTTGSAHKRIPFKKASFTSCVLAD